MKQTAVQWLIKELENLNRTQIEWHITVNQALEMERQQIIDAYSTPLSKNLPFMDDWQVLERSEQYYTQTFTEPKND